MFSYFSRPTLHVELEQSTVFVHAPNRPDAPADDPLIHGQVTMDVLKPTAVESVHVSLRGVTDVCAGTGQPYETTTNLEKSLDIDVKGELLEPGKHTFRFSFIIPSSTAPYQRCVFGRNRMIVEAKAQLVGKVMTGCSSEPVEFYVVANPSNPGEAPETFQMTLQDVRDDLGPVALVVTSPHLTVSSLLFYDLVLLAPPPGLKIFSMTSYVEQAFVCHYQDGKTVQPQPQRRLIFRVDHQAGTQRSAEGTTPMRDRFPTDRVNRGFVTTQDDWSLPTPDLGVPCSTACPPPITWTADAPLTQTEPAGGVEWHHRRVARMPDDDLVRPSTLAFSDAKIRVSHKLVCDMRYQLAGSDKHRFIKFDKSIEIASCCCMLDSLVLPSYAREAPRFPDARLRQRTGKSVCLCTLSGSTDQMLAADLASTPPLARTQSFSSDAGSVVVGDRPRARRSMSGGNNSSLRSTSFGMQRSPSAGGGYVVATTSEIAAGSGWDGRIPKTTPEQEFAALPSYEDSQRSSMEASRAPSEAGSRPPTRGGR